MLTLTDLHHAIQAAFPSAADKVRRFRLQERATALAGGLPAPALLVVVPASTVALVDAKALEIRAQLLDRPAPRSRPAWSTRHSLVAQREAA